MASSAMGVAAAATTSFIGFQTAQFHPRMSPPTVQLTIGRKRAVSPSMAMSTTTKGSLGFARGGAGVLERPTFDQSQFDPTTQVEEGGDMGRLKDRKTTGRGDLYKVLLHGDERHTENLVAKALPQAVPSVTPDEARKLFDESQSNGVAVVITTVKEHAEFYVQMMTRGGLTSSFEPDSDTV